MIVENMVIIINKLIWNIVVTTTIISVVPGEHAKHYSQPNHREAEQFLLPQSPKRRAVMGSETPLRLPVIDFSDPELKPGTPQWNLVKAQVQKALEEYGCFELFFNKVHLELRKALFSGVEEVFDLPLQTKLRNISTKPYHGYVGHYPHVPLYESMGIDDAPVLEKAEHFTNLMWPEGNASFWYYNPSLPCLLWKNMTTAFSCGFQLLKAENIIKNMFYLYFSYF